MTFPRWLLILMLGTAKFKCLLPGKPDNVGARKTQRLSHLSIHGSLMAQHVCRLSPCLIMNSSTDSQSFLIGLSKYIPVPSWERAEVITMASLSSPPQVLN